MHGHPTLGVKGAKPRLSSRPGPQIGKLSEEYLKIRNRQMNTKALTAEMQLAERRSELVEKRLVESQAAYLLVAMRQAALNIPQAYARRILNITDSGQAKEILREAMVSLLNTIKGLPNTVTDPNWLDALEGNGSPYETVEARKRSGSKARS